MSEKAQSFWVTDPKTGKSAHVLGDPDMSEEGRAALLDVIRAGVQALTAGVPPNGTDSGRTHPSKHAARLRVFPEFAPATLTVRAANVLNNYGVKNADGLLALDLEKTRRWRHCGEKTRALFRIAQEEIRAARAAETGALYCGCGAPSCDRCHGG